MNKDLLLIFVIGPLVVEIGKAIIKEFQDRKDIRKKNKKELTLNARSMLLDVEKTFTEFSTIEGPNVRKDDLRGYLLRLMAETGETLRHLAIYDTIREDYFALMHNIGAHIFNEKLMPEATKETLRGQISEKINTVLEKVGLVGLSA